MKITLKILFVILLSAASVFPQQKKNTKHSMLNIDCKTCHACQYPTTDDPCLKACPRLKMVTVYRSPDEAPAITVLNELENKYEPVVFPHRLHAQMSEISGGCITCHHYNTLGPVLPCKRCHSTERKREDVSKPDLMGAYHQQCLTCHRQWSHKTECVSCHKPKVKGKKLNIEQKILSYKQKKHPQIKEPTRIIFETEYKKGKIVTFYHNEHTKLFGLKCVNCHKEENCLRCHDVKNASNQNPAYYDTPVKIHLPKDQHHKICMKCHRENNCSFCHKNKVSETFDHGLRTGWKLNRFHKDLSCKQCHKHGNRFVKRPTACNSCHPDWKPGTFDHKITGLILDDNHSDIDCEDCHIGRDFSKKPTCNNCHDDKSFPKDKPGKED